VLKAGDFNPPEPGTDAKALAVSRFTYAKGRQGLAFWYFSNLPTSSLRLDSIAFEAKGVSFADPVLVDLVTGRAFELGTSRFAVQKDGTAFTDIPAWDAPAVIAERQELSIVK